MTVMETETLKAGTEPEIHLYAGQTTGEAVIPIRWCTCQSLFEKLKAEDAKKLYLFLIVVDKYKRESRKLLPLNQAMEYVTFYTPDEHKLFAKVVWDVDGKVGRLRKKLLGVEQNGQYATKVLDYNFQTQKTTLFPSFGGVCPSRGPVEPLLTVNVAPEFFAKKPPEWLRRWTNWWFETGPRDQCQFRRRCILAFTIQPPIALFWFIGSFLVRLASASFLFFFLGSRGIDFKPVVFLRKYSIEDIWAENDGYKRWGAASFFTRDKKGKERPMFVRLLSLLIPALIFIPQAIAKLCGQNSHSWLEIGVIAIGVWVGTVALFAVCHFIWKPIAKKREAARLAEANDPAALERERKRKWLAEREREGALRRAREARFDRQYQEMVCPGVPLKASIEALSPSRRTLYLRFNALKKRVCKPFAR